MSSTDPQIVYDELVALKSQVTEINERIDHIIAAFPKDEDDKPDFYGHRVFHKNETRKLERSTESWIEIRRRVITWAIIGILTIAISGITQLYMIPAVATVIK